MYESIDAMINNGQVLTGKRVGIALVKKDRVWTATIACDGEVAVRVDGSSVAHVMAKLEAECAGMVMPA